MECESTKAPMQDQRNADLFLPLLARHDVEIRSRLLLWIPDWNDAQDVAQEVTLVLWKKFDQFRPGTNFMAWALTIAKLESKKYWSRRARDRQLFTGDLIELIADDADKMAHHLDRQRELLKYCLDRLKPAQRDLLFERYSPGRTIEQLAARLSRSTDALYKALARLRMSLIDCVQRRTAIGERS